MRRLKAIPFMCPYCSEWVQTWGHVAYCRKKQREREQFAGEPLKPTELDIIPRQPHERVNR